MSRTRYWHQERVDAGIAASTRGKRVRWANPFRVESVPSKVDSIMMERQFSLLRVKVRANVPSSVG